MTNSARKGINTVRLIVGILSVALLVTGVYMLIDQRNQTARRQNTAQNLQNMYPGSSAGSQEETKEDEVPVTETTVVEQPHAPAQPQPSNVTDGLELQYDFYELYQYNNDLVGWIEVGSHMSMPVVYRDNEFYLSHDYYGNPDKAGTLFINEANTIWPPDTNLLFHGHNMRDGSVFGDLDDYRDVQYLKDNIIVTFRTIYDEEPTNYVLFSLFDASMNPNNAGYFDAGYINFDDTAEFNEYFDDVQRRNYFNTPFDIREDDHFLTLFTCSYSNDNGRFMLFCRALRDDETVDSIRAMAQQITKK